MREISQDLIAHPYGWVWGHTRSFGTRISSVTTGALNGNSWFVQELPNVVDAGSSNFTVVGVVNEALWFTKSGSNYIAKFFISEILVEDTTNKIFKLTDRFGRVFTFFNFDAANGGNKGRLKSATDANGTVTNVNYTSSTLTSIVFGSSPAVEFDYTYGTNSQLQYVTMLKGGTNVRRVSYAYYGTGSSNGNNLDLQTATVQQWNGSSWDTLQTTYYRYWTTNDAPTGAAQYQLKYVLRPEAYARAAAYAASIGSTVDSLSDASLAGFADNHFNYDPTAKRVTTEVVNAQGTATSSSTTSYGYAYTDSTNTGGPNNWKRKTVETLPDGNTNTVYTNDAGQVMLRVFTRTSDSAVWYEYYQYDSSNRVTMKAESSAVASVSEASAGLVTLNTSIGLIRVYAYYSTTNIAIGAVAGYLQYEKVQQGSTGTPVTVKEYQYTSQTAGSVTVYPLAKDIAYRSDASGGSNPAETDYSYTFFSGTVRIQQTTTTWPVVSTSENGSGSASSRIEIFDQYGNRTWLKDERGFLTRWKPDAATGSVLQRIDDVDTTQISDTPSVPTGWTTPSGGGLHLITDYTVDNLGRTTQELGPSHSVDLSGTSTTIRRATWNVFKDAAGEQRKGFGYATGSGPSYTYTLVNPVIVRSLDQSGRLISDVLSKRDPAVSGALTATEDFTDQTRWVRWISRYYSNNSRQLTYSRRYFSIPSSGTGSVAVNYDQMDYGYSSVGIRNRVKTFGGTIRRLVYHEKGWLISKWVGTDDTGATDGDPTGGGATGNNMVEVETLDYDNGSAGGDGNLTTQTRHQDSSSSNDRVATYSYDFRKRRITAAADLGFFESYTYDNLDHLIQIDAHDSSSSGVLIGRTKFNFDSRSRQYQRIVYAVNPNTGAVGNALTNDIWFDPVGLVIKRRAAGTSLLEKTVRDGIAREATVYYSTNTAETGYPYPISIASDVVLKQIDRTFDSASNEVLLTMRERMHDASGTGGLGTPSVSPTARISYLASWHDPLGRVQNLANYGTNGGSSFTRPSTAPSRSATVFVATGLFNDRGEPYSFTDPNGVITLLTRDDAGRLTDIVRDSGGIGQETVLTYTPDDLVLHQTVKNSITGDQITKYVYGVDLTTSDLASNLHLRAVIYPDSSDGENPLTGTDHVEYKYNRLSECREVKDQNGNVHTYDLDKQGRLLHDRVTTLGSGIDASILRVSQTWDIRGLLSTVTSYSSAVVGSGTILNDIQYAYNDFRQRITEFQSHSGAVNTSTSPKVQYAFANGSANHIRPTSITYPNGRVITYDYGTSGGQDDLLSRISSVKDGSTILVGYSFLGLYRIVKASYSSQPGVDLTYIKQSGESTGDAGDQYTGLDRFGRVVDQRWIKTSSSTAVARIQHGFNENGKRLWRADLVAATGQDEFYTYDALSQLTDLKRGTLLSDHSGINGTPSWEEIFNFDTAGNWHGSSTGYATKVSGSTTLDQNRSHSMANEISGITTSSGTAWPSPAHDGDGNTTTFPRPLSMSTSHTAVYDAWDRLVKINTSGTVIGTYAYDGLNRRISKLTTFTRHFYYSSAFQCLEERVGTSTCVERQFVWGLRYIDDLIVRDLDTSGGSSSSSCAGTNQRFYVLHDSFNVIGIVDTSGSVQERYGYDGFGNLRVMTASFGSRANSLYSWETLYGAHRLDSESALYLMRSRYYHPLLGRFLSRDPIGYKSGNNLYAYAANSPVNAVDILGLKTCFDSAAYDECAFGCYLDFLGCLDAADSWYQQWNDSVDFAKSQCYDGCKALFSSPTFWPLNKQFIRACQHACDAAAGSLTSFGWLTYQTMNFTCLLTYDTCLAGCLLGAQIEISDCADCPPGTIEGSSDGWNPIM